MDRRAFNVSLMKASAAALLLPRVAGRVLAEEPSPAELYAKAIVIDSLCAPFGDIDAPPSPKQITAVRASGITAINFTISTPDFEQTIDALADVQKLVDDHPEIFLIV